MTPLAAGWLDPNLSALTTATVYAVVLGFVFVESGLLVGFLLPGDSLLFAAGLLSAAPGSGLSLGWLALGVLVAAVAGDAVGYLTGRRLGRPWLERRTAGGRFPPSALPRAEAFYARWGALAVVAARWVPWVRTFTPVLAGVARMPYRRFLPANVAGALTWGGGLVLLGHLAASVTWLRQASYAVAGLAVLGSVVMGVWAATRRRGGDPATRARRGGGDPATRARRRGGS